MGSLIKYIGITIHLEDYRDSKLTQNLDLCYSLITDNDVTVGGSNLIIKHNRSVTDMYEIGKTQDYMKMTFLQWRT